jgi:RimJ/RimL family protein N-acetyltransferase
VRPAVPTPEECCTARLHLTRIRATDLDDLAELHADARVMATLGGLRSRPETVHFLAGELAHWEKHGFGLWVARDQGTGRFAGRGGLRHVIVGNRPEVEVAYALMPDFWGRGLATELARASARIGFTALRRTDLVCYTQPTNRASRRVMEKAGFRYEREVTHAALPHVLYRQTAAGWYAGGAA